MSLATRIADLATAIGTDIKALFGRALPAGGAAGQVLAKTAAADYAAGWVDQSGGGAVATEVGVSLGATPSRSGRFFVVDAGVSSTDQIRVELAASPYTGKGPSQGDESELMGPVQFVAKAQAGQFVVHWSSAFVQRGTVKVRYQKG